MIAINLFVCSKGKLVFYPNIPYYPCLDSVVYMYENLSAHETPT